MEFNLNGPSDEVVAIAKRAVNLKDGDEWTIADVKRLANAVIQFQGATARLESFVDQLKAAGG